MSPSSVILITGVSFLLRRRQGRRLRRKLITFVVTLHESSLRLELPSLLFLCQTYPDNNDEGLPMPGLQEPLSPLKYLPGLPGRSSPPPGEECSLSQKENFPLILKAEVEKVLGKIGAFDEADEGTAVIHWGTGIMDEEDDDDECSTSSWCSEIEASLVTRDDVLWTRKSRLRLMISLGVSWDIPFSDDDLSCCWSFTSSVDSLETSGWYLKGCCWSLLLFPFNCFLLFLVLLAVLTKIRWWSIHPSWTHISKN